jgi:hypothetical protein
VSRDRAIREPGDPPAVTTIDQQGLDYTVAVHPAHGLEYGSVQVVTTHSMEDDIAHGTCEEDVAFLRALR